MDKVKAKMQTEDERDKLGYDALSRREFIGRTSALLATLSVGSSFLAACGGSGGGSTGKIGGTLNMLSFEPYDFPKQMAAWKKAHGVNLAASYIATPDDVTAKLRGAPNSGIDLTTYDSPRKEVLEQLGLIQEIDESKIPNLAGLAPYFKRDPEGWWKNSAGKRIGVPWSWGALGILYYEGQVARPSSYRDLLDPKLKKRIVVLDSANDVLSTTGKALGIDMTTLTQAQFERIKSFARSMLRQSGGLATSWGDVATQLGSGQAVASYPGSSFVPSLAAEASKNRVKFVSPKEGGITFFDAWAIPKGADNVDTALAWINETLNPRTNPVLCNFVAYGTAVAAAVPRLDPSIRTLYAHGASFETYIKKSPFYRMPPLKSSTYVTYPELLASWEDIKASA